MGRMSQQEINDLLCEPNISIIATLHPDGTPHMTPVWHLIDGDRVILAVEEKSVKARNVRNDSRVALCIATRETPQRWAQVSGAAILSREGVADVVRKMSVHYMGVEKGERYAEQVLEDLNFILIKITPIKTIGFEMEG